MTTLRSILVAIDGSAPSLTALDHALALAGDYDATIEVLGVVPGSTAESAALNLRVAIERAVDAAVARARRTLGAGVSRRIVAGDPLQKIIEIARDGFDLLVMGTHGRVGRLHEVLGSVAEGAVRNAPCPVLTVRDPRDGYQSFAERRHNRPALAEQATIGDSASPRQSCARRTGG